MVCETTKPQIDLLEPAMDARAPLLPDRMRQADFFVCDIFDAAPKGDMASMEHPVFSISTKPDKRIRRYENSRGRFVEVIPSGKGLATVHDRDVLIFCISQTIAALNSGQQVSQTLRFKAHDFMRATNRPTGGESYRRLRETLDRLRGTTISTNVTTGDKEVTDGFGLIDTYRIVRETRDGRMQDIEIKLSDWVFNAINANEVLTIHRNYFRLRKPLERRIYEIARKHCGHAPEFTIKLETLRLKCGSSSTDKEFRRLVGKIVAQDRAHGHIPDYSVELDRDAVIFRNREAWWEKHNKSAADFPVLSTETFNDARIVAPSLDPYVLEQEWRDMWDATGRPALQDPNKAFLGFCRKRAERT
jgi:hypothetical protein